MEYNHIADIFNPLTSCFLKYRPGGGSLGVGTSCSTAITGGIPFGGDPCDDGEMGKNESFCLCQLIVIVHSACTYRWWCISRRRLSRRSHCRLGCLNSSGTCCWRYCRGRVRRRRSLNTKLSNRIVRVLYSIKQSCCDTFSSNYSYRWGFIRRRRSLIQNHQIAT